MRGKVWIQHRDVIVAKKNSLRFHPSATARDRKRLLVLVAKSGIFNSLSLERLNIKTNEKRISNKDLNEDEFTLNETKWATNVAEAETYFFSFFF